jgi:hypothetical protein
MPDSVISSAPETAETPRRSVRIVVPTTAAQRREARRIYKETGDWREACRRTRMATRTFWYWMARADAEGEEALDSYKSRARHSHPNQIAPEIVAETYALHKVHPKWGKRRLADEVRKAHDWKPVIGATKVGELLREWRAAEAQAASAFSPSDDVVGGSRAR